MKRKLQTTACTLAASLLASLAADARNIAPLGNADIGNKEESEADPANAEPGYTRANAGIAFHINDGNPDTRVDSFGGGERLSYIGILWPETRTDNITSLTLTMAVFFDGGWFGSNDYDPESKPAPQPGETLSASRDLAEPIVQVTTDGGASWTTVEATSDYMTALDGHPLPAVAFGPPTAATVTFNLTTPQTAINGVRILGPAGGTADNGFIGVFELAVEAESPQLNVATQGTGIIGVNDDIDDDEGTMLEHAGFATSVTDGNYTTRVDTWGNGTDPMSFAGVLWPAPRPDAVKTIKLHLATFFDGGWFGVPGEPIDPIFDSEYYLAAEELIVPQVQATTDGGATWTNVEATSDYLAKLTNHLIGNAQRNPTVATATFEVTSPVAGWNGLRIIGPNGGVADGNGFLGVYELEVFTVPAGDTDADGMSDAWELANGLNVGVDDSAGDPDGDGRTNIEEFLASTDPNKADTDEDGLNDGVEAGLGTNPLAKDTDGDGLTDGQEVDLGSNPLLVDSDGDGLEDGDEANVYGTNPASADTDGDGFRDNVELNYDTSPLDPNSVPPNEALAGTAIIGVNDAIDGDSGTPLAHAGVAESVNDDDLLTRVDTWGSSGTTAGFVGIVWDTPRTRAITKLELTLAIFFDGGWFGYNGDGPGTGGFLSTDYLLAPIVQATTDGVTWTNVDHTSDYLHVFTDHPLPDVDFGPPTSATATFTLDAPLSGITGIRIIGEEGGTVDNGFIGVFELAALTTEVVIPPGDSDGDGQSNASEAIAGTNPNDPKDYLRVTSITRTGNQVQLTWTSVPGKTYNIESSTDLTNWTVVAPGIPAAANPATETQTTVTLTDPVPGRLTLRAVVVP